MTDLNEKLAQEAAELINGGEFYDGKWYSDGHRDAWRRAMKPAADRIEQLEALLDEEAVSQTLFDAVVSQRDKANDRIEQLEAALRSIAANTCCDSCREAALVARKALEGGR